MLSILAILAFQTPPPTPPVAPKPAPWTQADLEKVAEVIRHQVEELHGMKFKAPVAVKLTDKPGFLEYVRKRQQETESPEKRHRDETTAKLLGLIPPSMDYQATLLAILEKQVGGFYDPGSKTFYLMDSFTGDGAKVILAHELTHALDDQYHDIDGTLAKCGDDTDASIAYQAVVEGSATGLMNQWYLKHASEISTEDLARTQAMGADAFTDVPPFLWKPLMAVYFMGDSFLARSSGLNATMKAAATADVQRALTEPPRSSEQILHSRKYWDDARRDEPLKVSIDTSNLPQGWKLAGQDTLGELCLAMLSTPLNERGGLDGKDPAAQLRVQYTNKAAEGWGGDRLVLLERGEDRMLQLVTAWDTERDADEFAAALGDPRKPKAIPVFAGSARDAAQGWVGGSTPTDVIVSRESDAEGTTALVVVRVFSFSKPATSEAEAAQLILPWKVAAAPK